MHLWLVEHPDAVLPRGSSKAIARQTGLSIDEVKCYLYRKRKEAREAFRSLPDLRLVPLEFLAESGNRVISSDFKGYRFVLDRWSISAKLVLFSGDISETVDIPDVPSFISRLSSLKVTR